jgi:archaellum biogenesis ATPase FlaH
MKKMSTDTRPRVFKGIIDIFKALGSTDIIEEYDSEVVILDPMLAETLKKIEEGKIIVFNYDNKLVAHRVYKVIRKNNDIYFKTKGDNNEQVDSNLVEVSDIVGVVKTRIRYLGLPSIWILDMFE